MAAVLPASLRPAALLAVAAALLLPPEPAQAREFYIGGPVYEHDMEIVANYLVGIDMAPLPPDMPHGADVIHLEADVHATADNANGFPDGAWVGYLAIGYTLEKTGTPWTATGTLLPMQAKDGPHYAANVRMDGPGAYKVTYRFAPPDANGFLRHVDPATGVPGWWAPFAATFGFRYPNAS